MPEYKVVGIGINVPSTEIEEVSLKSKAPLLDY